MYLLIRLVNIIELAKWSVAFVLAILRHTLRSSAINEASPKAEASTKRP